jgi:hypothetical protein
MYNKASRVYKLTQAKMYSKTASKLKLKKMIHLPENYSSFNQVILGFCKPGGGGHGSLAPTVFGGSVNPISTDGAHSTTSLLHALSDFQTLRRPLSIEQLR